MKSKLAWCEHVSTCMYLHISNRCIRCCLKVWNIIHLISAGEEQEQLLLLLLFFFDSFQCEHVFGPFHIFRDVILFDLMSTEMNIVIDRHLKHTLEAAFVTQHPQLYLWS